MQDIIQTPGVSGSHPECVGQPEEQRGEDEEMVITGITSLHTVQTLLMTR